MSLARAAREPVRRPRGYDAEVGERSYFSDRKCSRSSARRLNRRTRGRAAGGVWASCRKAPPNRRTACSASPPTAAAARRAMSNRRGKRSRQLADCWIERSACHAPICGGQDTRRSVARNARMSEPEREKCHVRPISRQAGAGDSAPDSRASSGVRDRQGDFLPDDCAWRFGTVRPQDFVASCLVGRAGLVFLTKHRLGGPFAAACKDRAG